MKNILCLFLVIMALSFNKVQAEAHLSKVHVITSFYEPYSYLDNGNAQGVAVNHARKLFAQLNFYPVIDVYPWARAYKTALSAPNTLIFSMARTPEREDKFHWVGEIVGFNVFLYRDNNRPDIKLKSLRDAKHYRIGALSQDVKGQYLGKNNIPVTPLTNEETGIKMVQNGRIELLPMDKASMEHRLNKLNLPDDAMIPALHLKEISRPLYIAFSKNTDMEIVEKFRTAYEKVFPMPVPNDGSSRAW